MLTDTLTAPVRQALVNDGQFLMDALITGIIAPTDLDHQNDVQRAALMSALEKAPNLEVPTPVLARYPASLLWSHADHPAVSAFLAARITRQTADATAFPELMPDKTTGLPESYDVLFTPRSGYRSSFNEHERLLALPLDLQQALGRVFALTEVPVVLPQLCLSTGRLTDPVVYAQARAVIERANTQKRSEAAKKAATTRRTNRDAGQIGPAPKKDPLLAAIQSGETKRLQRFSFDFPPDRVAAILPAWLAAGIQMRQWLVSVPHLPTEVLLPAVEAWGHCLCQTNYGAHPSCRYPIPGHFLADLSTLAAAAVFREYLSRDPDYPGNPSFIPPPTPQEIESLLFRVSLETPAAAQGLQHALALRALMAEVKDAPAAPPPDDPEALWVCQYLKGINVIPPVTALALEALYRGWPPARQTALAPVFARAGFATALHTLLQEISFS
jgi:hypothetical protein